MANYTIIVMEEGYGSHDAEAFGSYRDRLRAEADCEKLQRYLDKCNGEGMTENTITASVTRISAPTINALKMMGWST